MSLVQERSVADWLNRRAYPFEAHYLDVEGGRMHYIEQGSGSPILFVHGWPMWSYCYRNVITQMQASYRCVAPDLIGFGLSDKPGESFSYSPTAHCRNLKMLVDKLDLHDITLVLHDFGGPVGLTVALDMPERISRICLMNTWMWDISPDPVASKTAKLAHSPLGPMSFLKMNSAAKGIRNMFEDKAKYTEDVCKAYAGPLARPEDRLGAFAVAKQMSDAAGWYDELWRNREKFLQTPLQMIWGMKDQTFGEKALNRIWHEFPLADVVQIQGAGHAVMEDNPRSVISALETFMTSTHEI